MSGQFRNPYNFIPLIDKPICADLDRQPPAGHHRYHKNLWSGRIEVRIEAVTPLLIPDAANVEGKDGEHRTFDIRKDRDGRALLPVTSLKGPLRSAYEAVTNSRFGVFKGHTAPPAKRMDSTAGAALVPARVVKCGDGFAIELWKGTSAGWPEWQKSKNNRDFIAIKNGNATESLYAAWLPRYRKGRGGLAPWAAKLRPKDEVPIHGREVYVLLERMQHNHRRFRYWRVRDIALRRNDLPRINPQPSPARDAHAPVTPADFRIGRGFVFVSEQNTENKHDERVFFVDDDNEGEPLTVMLAPEAQKELKTRWEQLIENYQTLHEKGLEERGSRKKAAKFISKEPGKTAYSRHIFTPEARALQAGTPFEPDEAATETGTLCYAQLKMNGKRVHLDKRGQPTIEALYPVMISRELGYNSPKDLLPECWRPAEALAQLSPADRVFGWVNQQRSEDGHSAYKGQLRIRSTECDTADAIETFEAPLPLSILGAPKVSQARFYVGQAPGSAPLDPKAKLGEVAYFDKAHPEKWTLRGWKVYPHQAATVPAEAHVQNYWDWSAALAEAQKEPVKNGVQAEKLDAPGAEYREFVRRQGIKRDSQGSSTRIANKDSQNRSVRGWIRPGSTFTATIEVTNLNDAELAVLLWLLDLPNQCEGPVPHHRIGGGKPLGFGSVAISIRSVKLETGEARAQRYRALFSKPDFSELEASGKPFRIEGDAAAGGGFVDTAFKAIKKESGTDFHELPHVAAFLQAARGYADDIPTHYPRTDDAPNPAGENFHWFVQNGKDNGPGKALPPILGETALPLLRDKD